jgi:nitroreductase
MTSSAHRAADYSAFLRGLRAIRQFRPQPIPQPVLDDILEVARWSGSASNRQPWELVVVRQAETLHALAAVEGYATHLAGAALGIVLVMAGEREETEIHDEGRLSERIMLAAAAHDVGSCIGWFVNGGVDAAKALLHIPAQRRVRTAIALGYPTPEALQPRQAPGQARKPLSAIVRDERYS